MTKLWIISLVAAATAIGLYLSNGSSNSSVKQIPMEIRQHFEQWTTQHARVYNTPEERNFRLNVFSKNYIFVTDYNTNHPGAAELGLTQFADLTPEEFVASSGAKQE